MNNKGEIPIIDLHLRYSYKNMFEPIAFFPLDNDLGEEWRFVYYPKEPNMFPNRYMVSNYGRVWDSARQEFCKQSTTYNVVVGGYNEEYYIVNLQRIHWPATQNGSFYQQCEFFKVGVHVLVLSTFNYIPGCENMYVNHKDLNKINNRLDNLEWTTPKQNYYHAVYNGALKPRQRTEILQAMDLLSLCKDMENNIPIEELVEKYNITPRYISQISQGKSHKQVSEWFNIPYYEDTSKKIANSLNDNIVHAICKDLQDGISQKDIYNKYNVKKHVVDGIIDGRNYRNISKQYKIPLRNKAITYYQADQIAKHIVEGYDDNYISNKFNVSKNTIYNIRTGNSYTNIYNKNNMNYEKKVVAKRISDEKIIAIAKYYEDHPSMVAACYDKQLADKFDVEWYNVRDIRLRRNYHDILTNYNF